MRGAAVVNASVAGGAGFTGGNLVERLLAAGHHVVAFDNFSTGQRSFLDPASRQSPPRNLGRGRDVRDYLGIRRALYVSPGAPHSLARPERSDHGPVTVMVALVASLVVVKAWKKRTLYVPGVIGSVKSTSAPVTPVPGGVVSPFRYCQAV